MDNKQLYIVVSGEEYGGKWCEREPDEWGNKTSSNVCYNCGNKLFIPKIFYNKYAAEEYVERYLNSYVDCFSEDIENRNDFCSCKIEIQICEIPTSCNDMLIYLAVSSAPYGGAFEQQCYECNGTEFMMKVFTEKEKAEEYINYFVQNVAPPCKSCMYNYMFTIIVV